MTTPNAKLLKLSFFGVEEGYGKKGIEQDLALRNF
jgi:hypothetical protein